MNSTRPEPLTGPELDRLEEILHKVPGNQAMGIEYLDGFFAALIAGPGLVLPSEYLPHVLGSGGKLTSAGETQEFFGLLMRHWNTIAGALLKDGVYFPVLMQDEDGAALCNDWAHGFFHGLDMRRSQWAPLIEDDEQAGCLIPMFAFHHEHDPDPEMRPDPISPEQRERLVSLMIQGLGDVYRYFRTHTPPPPPHPQPTPRAARTGRNDPCPCGSGKKYKRCCGAATVQ